jgi:hypothetical protein
MRVLLEVDSLALVPLQQLSRCGIVWFSDDNVTFRDVSRPPLGMLAKEDFVGDRSDQEILAARDSFLE